MTMMMCPYLLLLSASLLPMATAASSSSSTRMNNIMLLVTDDQDIELGSFDTRKYMPKLHAGLREQGVTWEHGALVHTPICCPSRSTLLTGRYLHSIQPGMAINNTVEGNCYGPQWKQRVEPYHTFAVHAQQAGYTTLYAGKYLNRYRHNSTHPAASVPPGWDYWYGLEGNSVYYNYTIVEGFPTSSQNKKDPILHRHGDRYPDDYLPLVLRNYTLEKITTLKEPWLMVIAWPTPHGPFTPEPKYSLEYPDTQAPRTKSYNATTCSQQAKHWLIRQLGPIKNKTAQRIDDIYRNRLRALKTVDDHIGELIRVLEKQQQEQSSSAENQNEGISISSPKHDDDDYESGRSAMGNIDSSNNNDNDPAGGTTLADRTVIIYTSDNGFQFGQHRLSIDKRHLYEHDVRVPFVVRVPPSVLLPRNVTVPKHVIVSIADIAPTILDIVLDGWLEKLNKSNNSIPRRRAPNNDAVNGNKEEPVDNWNIALGTISRLREAMDKMNGLSFWRYLRQLQQNRGYNGSNRSVSIHDNNAKKGENCGHDDAFLGRTDVLISYHGEGNPSCGMSECPPPFNELWWMPDSYNNTYHCVRTITASRTFTMQSDFGIGPHYHDEKNRSNEHEMTDTVASVRRTGEEVDEHDSMTVVHVKEDSIYCVFHDDEDFVEFYDLNTNLDQMGNDYHALNKVQVQRYKKRLKELLLS